MVQQVRICAKDAVTRKDLYNGDIKNEPKLSAHFLCNIDTYLISFFLKITVPRAMSNAVKIAGGSMQ